MVRYRTVTKGTKGLSVEVKGLSVELLPIGNNWLSIELLPKELKG